LFAHLKILLPSPYQQNSEASRKQRKLSRYDLDNSKKEMPPEVVRRTGNEKWFKTLKADVRNRCG